MRQFLIIFLSIFTLTATVKAQIFPPELNWEVGINGGYSICTRPIGPPDPYIGNSTNWVSDFSIRGGYFINPNWQVNLDIGTRHWESYGTWKLNGLFGTTLEPQNLTIVAADHAISTTLQLNYVIPFYTQFQVYNKANFYFGATFGMISTLNDGATSYNYYKNDSTFGNKYVSKFDYGNGNGMTFGIQTGFTYYIVPKIGINIELGTRYAWVATSSTEFSNHINRYYLLYFPETIGIRYRL